MELHEVQQRGRPIGRTVRPQSLGQALTALRDHPAAQPVAGGTDLFLDLQRGDAGPAVDLVDLSAVTDGAFTSITETSGSLLIGGGVTHNTVVRSAPVLTFALPLAQACAEVGSPQLRNRATVAGNVATASPANDTISALMALDARLHLARMTTDGVSIRRLPLAEFFDGFRSTVLAPGELIEAIEVPKLSPAHRGIWVKLGLRKAQAISVVHAGLVVEFEDGSAVAPTTTPTVRSARLALGSVAATVVVVDEFADALRGKPLTPAVIGAAAHAAADAVTPISDVRATAEYRSGTLVTVLRRALQTLAEGRQTEMWLADPPTLDAPTLDAPTLDTGILDAAVADVSVSDPFAPAASTAVAPSRFVVRPENESALLLDALRDDGMLSVKEGCAEGECGACTVRVNGAAVMSCLVGAAQVPDADIVTAQHLGSEDSLDIIQQAFVDEFAAQCGFCIPGFIVAVSALLDETPDPSDDQIAMALSGNLCRCTGYYPIIEAVKTAARLRAAGSA